MSERRTNPSAGGPAAELRPAVPVVYVARLLEVLRADGISGGRVLHGSGVTASEIADPSQKISLVQQRMIYARAARLCGRRDLGIHLGRKLKLSDHGVFGYAVYSSADFAQALRIVARYAVLTGPLFNLQLEQETGRCRLTLTPRLPLGDALALAGDEMLTVIALQLLSLTTPAVRPEQLVVGYRGAPLSAYRRLFLCPVRYRAGATFIDIPPAALQLPTAMADVETAAICEQRCQDLLADLGRWQGVVDSVRRVLITDLRRAVSLPAVAATLNMSERSLRRRLQDEGTSFREVRDKVRQALAEDYLRHSTLPLEEIADLLGYTSVQNFHRAFRRWTGTTPGGYRRS